VIENLTAHTQTTLAGRHAVRSRMSPSSERWQ